MTGGDRYHPTYGGAGGGGRIAMIAKRPLSLGNMMYLVAVIPKAILLLMMLFMLKLAKVV